MRASVKNEAEPQTGDLWARFAPTAEEPWDLARVVHLHRRAGLGASWGEIERDLKEGHEPSIQRILKGDSHHENLPEQFSATSELLADAAVASRDPNRLAAWWVYRLLFSPDPLGERLTLMWHNHFATSNIKVDDPWLMRRQNDTLRKLARAPFGEILAAMLHDPALLAWLDAPANRKGHANENLGRELMELFTLGVGKFTEDDVKGSARALTGLSVKEGEYQYVTNAHDDGEKSIFGKRGKWTPDDLAKMLLENPATSQRLAFRITEMLMGEKSIPEGGVDALAKGLREHNLEIGWAVEKVLRSRAFFAKANLNVQVSTPVCYVIAPVHALGLLDSPPSTLVLADWIGRIGQDLFYPPNVGGWPGGRAWLNSRSLIARANYAVSLVEDRPIGRALPFDALAMAERQGLPRDRKGALRAASKVLLGHEPDRDWSHKLQTKSAEEPAAARQNVALLLASPQGQVQ